MVNKKTLFFLIVFLKISFLISFSFFSYAASKQSGIDKKDNLVHKKDHKKSAEVKNKKEVKKKTKKIVKEKTNKNRAFNSNTLKILSNAIG